MMVNNQAAGRLPSLAPQASSSDQSEIPSGAMSLMLETGRHLAPKRPGS
jgi:hypothetical protein